MPQPDQAQNWVTHWHQKRFLQNPANRQSRKDDRQKYAQLNYAELALRAAVKAAVNKCADECENQAKSVIDSKSYEPKVCGCFKPMADALHQSNTACSLRAVAALGSICAA
jgi:hypothetical protein